MLKIVNSFVDKDCQLRSAVRQKIGAFKTHEKIVLRRIEKIRKIENKNLVYC